MSAATVVSATTVVACKEHLGERLMPQEESSSWKAYMGMFVKYVGTRDSYVFK